MPIVPDDPRLARLLKELPGASPEFVMILYRIDRLIDEMKYLEVEARWSKEKIANKRDEIVKKTLEEIEKLGEKGARK